MPKNRKRLQLRNIHFQLNVPCFHGNANGGGGDGDSGCGRDADDVDERYNYSDVSLALQGTPCQISFWNFRAQVFEHPTVTSRCQLP